MKKQNKKFEKMKKDLEPMLFEKIMSSGGLDSYRNYIGHDWSGWIVFLGKNRDSDVLTLSNFDTALEDLGGEIDGKIEVRSANHWACGWIEQIMIRFEPKNHIKLKKALKMKKALEDYPVLDESDFSEREHEERNDWAEQQKESTALVLCKILDLDPDIHSEKSDLLSLAYDCQYTHMLNSGNDSSLQSNHYHDISDRELNEYKRVFEDWDFQSNNRENEYFLRFVEYFQIKIRN